MKTTTLGILIVTCSATQLGWAQTNSTPAASSPALEHYHTQATLRPPAVDEPNGKISYTGGRMDSAEGHNFDASIAFPITRQFGFQADALYSRISSQDFSGAAGHIFWRDPDLGLIGLAGGFLTRDGVDTYQVGVEAEYYFHRFTFGAFAGAGSISYDNPAPFINTDPTRFIGRISADYYLLEDLRIGASYITAFHDNLGKFEAEYQTPIRGLAVTAEVAVGNNHYDHWLFGVRYYFGGNKTLRDRQRKSDPPSLMPQVIQGLGLYGAEYNRKAKEYFNTYYPGGTSGSGNYGLQWDTFGSTFTTMNVINIPPLPQFPPPPQAQ